jgi:3D (Asp-Asp-Asp) domain-containing protein
MHKGLQGSLFSNTKTRSSTAVSTTGSKLRPSTSYGEQHSTTAATTAAATHTAQHKSLRGIAVDKSTARARSALRADVYDQYERVGLPRMS